MNKSFAILTLLAFAALAFSACREKETTSTGFTPRERAEAGEPRAYQLGFSALPAALTDEAYLAAFDFAANFGEVLLIQRPPSWTNFLPGVLLSDELRDFIITERTAVREREVALMLALDPFDPTDRGRLAGLPPGFVGEDLDNPDLRQAFIAEARYLALNYRPAYLVLGTEVNAAFEHNPSGYEAFVDAYREAYRQVKEASPETLVFVSFQFEQLLGLIPSEPPHVARWELLADFDGVNDYFAITSYPSFAFSVARKVPPLYYSQILEHTDLALAFVSAGYASAPGREGLNSSTTAEQRRFLQRLFRDADELGATLVIWFTALDPAYATEPPLDLLASIGLRTSDDQPKEAWPTWEETLARPYDRAAATESHVE
ncbi:MAG TPA: hypothetical protein QGI71_09270 [Dehalococcoidia bacterium]|nr:hypothetical protein [Dehalococcoidia bacterium]